MRARSIFSVDAMNDQRISARPRRWIGVSAAAVVAVAGLAVAGTAAATPSTPATATGRSDAVQQSLDHLVNDDKYPAALAAVQARGGRIRDYTSGVGDLRTERPGPPGGDV